MTSTPPEPESAEALLRMLEQLPEQLYPLDGNAVRAARRWLGSAVCDRIGVFALPDDFRLTVIIPVFNEVQTVQTIVDRLRKTGLPLEIILVDDGSTDGTRAELKRLESEQRVRVCFHEQNQGKGAAIRTGLEHATGDVIVIQDADLEYNPIDFWWLLQPILQDRADVVYGSRYTQATQAVPPLWHRAVNRFISTLTSWAIGKRFSDVETCYKMMRREVIQPLVGQLQERRFGIEIELTFRLARQARARFFEVPIRYERRTYAEGKKITWRDGFAALWCILKYSFLASSRHAVTSP